MNDKLLQHDVCEPLPYSPYRAKLLAKVGLMPHA